MLRKNLRSFLFVLVFFILGMSFAALADTPSITLDRKKLTLKVGNTYTLKAQVTGTEEKIVWKSTNKKIATVAQSGKVRAKKPGTVKIKAVISGKKAFCRLTVKKKDLSSFLGKKMSLVEKKIKGGTHPVRNVAETGYYDAGWVEFSYGVPVQTPKAESIVLKKKKTGYTLMGLTVKMSEAKAFEVLGKKGWTVTERSYSNGHYVKWNRSGTTNYIMLWVEHRKVERITYSMDLS